MRIWLFLCSCKTQNKTTDEKSFENEIWEESQGAFQLRVQSRGPPESLSGVILGHAFPHTLFPILFHLYSLKSNVEHLSYATRPARYWDRDRNANSPCLQGAPKLWERRVGHRMAKPAHRGWSCWVGQDSRLRRVCWEKSLPASGDFTHIPTSLALCVTSEWTCSTRL